MNAASFMHSLLSVDVALCMFMYVCIFEARASGLISIGSL